MASIYWYDLETFGRNPFYDRIAQFAGLRTDDNFEPVGAPLVLYCALSPDYLPDPGACMLTGITPQTVQEKGIPEAEFVQRILDEFSRPGTCVAGYNSIRFDDEFIRNALYRTFRDPYEREYQHGNTRWDILDLLRTAHDLRPEGIEWIRHEDGRPDFTLESLAAANKIDHRHAHDALSDVYATIGLAKLVHDKQPRLFRYLFRLRKKQEVWKQIDLYKRSPFLHTSGMFTTPSGCTRMVAPLTVDPNNGNCVLCYDLGYDPEALIALPEEEIRRRIFTPADQLDEERIHIKGIHVNRAPSISPAKLADEKTAGRLGIDLELCRENYRKLKKGESLIQKVRKVFTERQHEETRDPDLQIYSGGFFKDSDRENFVRVRGSSPEELPGLKLDWEDPRIPEMLWRYIFRNYPDVMPEEEKRKWRSFCASRILIPSADGAMRLPEFRKRLAAYNEDKTLAPRKKLIAGALEEYARSLENEILD
jgi:exodeoxyribonuclease I